MYLQKRKNTLPTVDEKPCYLNEIESIHWI